MHHNTWFGFTSQMHSWRIILLSLCWMTRMMKSFMGMNIPQLVGFSSMFGEKTDKSIFLMYLFIIYWLFVCLCVGVIMKTCLYKTAGPSKPPLSTTMTATVTKPVIFFFPPPENYKISYEKKKNPQSFTCVYIGSISMGSVLKDLL